MNNALKNTHAPLVPFYPDVIGAITGGPRINMGDLETAIGIHPKVAFLNQPIEVVIALQNMVDREMQVKIGIRAPNEDRKGNVVIIEVSRPMISITLKPGEVGVLRVPLIAHPPTPSGKDFPIRVAIRYRVKEGHAVRPPGGGSPPSVLSVSPFKLQVLRDIEFIAHKWNESTDILSVYFDLAPKHFPGDHDDLKPGYETLWQEDVMKQEIQLASERYEDALEIAKPGARGTLYLSLYDALEEHFAKHEMPLHPGEAMAIAKMLAYTVEDAPGREPDVVLDNTRWFRSLCQVLAHNPELVHLDRNTLISKHIIESVIYEAILLAFRILRGQIRENLGTREEQLSYANKFMTWFAGHGEADLSYVYLPLVLGGVAVGRLVRGAYGENPWDLADQLEEASNGRRHLASQASEVHVIFDMLNELLEGYRRKLRAQRIERHE